MSQRQSVQYASIISDSVMTLCPFSSQLQQRVHQILNLRGGSVKVVRHIMRGEGPRHTLLEAERLALTWIYSEAIQHLAYLPASLLPSLPKSHKYMCTICF